MFKVCQINSDFTVLYNAVILEHDLQYPLLDVHVGNKKYNAPAHRGQYI